MGIPHSQFLSWDELDQDKALAFNATKGDVCPECGTREEDWIDEDGFPLDTPIYQPHAHRCHGCYQVAQFKETVPDTQKGIHVILITAEQWGEIQARHQGNGAAV